MKIILIAGPTATGKTEVSVKLAHKINAEIISMDSMQVYKGLDIGTAKANEQEMDGIKHYMIDVLDPTENCSVAWFKSTVKDLISDISARGKIPILVGGTGFYINAVLFDTNFDEQITTDYKAEFTAFYYDYGKEQLFAKLQDVDPESASTIHPNNVKRVIRALEFFSQNGFPISKHNKEEKYKRFDNISPYDYTFFALNMSRDTLYSRINRRVDLMVDNGLFHEVEKLFNRGLDENLAALQGIGYKELFPFFKGQLSKDEVIDILKRNTRRFAKRQITWFNHQSNPIFIEVDELGFNSEKIANTIIELSNLRKF